MSPNCAVQSANALHIVKLTIANVKQNAEKNKN